MVFGGYFHIKILLFWKEELSIYNLYMIIQIEWFADPGILDNDSDIILYSVNTHYQ